MLYHNKKNSSQKIEIKFVRCGYFFNQILYITCIRVLSDMAFMLSSVGIKPLLYNSFSISYGVLAFIYKIKI